MEERRGNICFQLHFRDDTPFFNVEVASLDISFFILMPEPTAAPKNVTGHNSSSTSILVTWDDVPAADQNGIILTYTITYESLTENHNENVTVNYPARQTNLTRLREYVNYSITVFASTVKGNGPPSNPIFVITDQASK